MIIAPGLASFARLWRGGKLPSFSCRSCVDWKMTQGGMTMTRLSLIGVAAVAAATAFAVPALAQHRITHPANAYANVYAQAGVCGYQEPGNPWSKNEDYMAWSAWRARGGWDDRVDSDCLNRMSRPGF
jgi:hypothetical protein